MIEDFDKTMLLIKQEINDAKLKAFDKLLFFLLKEEREITPEELEKMVVVIYNFYKEEIKKVVRLYTMIPDMDSKVKKTMQDFLKDLKDIET